MNLDLGLLDFDYFTCFADGWLRFRTGDELPGALGLETHFRVLPPREGTCARAEDGLLADFKRGVRDRKDEFEEARRHPWSIFVRLRSAGRVSDDASVSRKKIYGVMLAWNLILSLLSYSSLLATCSP